MCAPLTQPEEHLRGPRGRGGGTGAPGGRALRGGADVATHSSALEPAGILGLLRLRAHAHVLFWGGAIKLLRQRGSER